MHSTSNLKDGYMGSGKILRYSIRKYGKNNHTVEILKFFDTRELLIESEIKAITNDMIQDKNCMNLTEGGSGGNGARFLTKEQLSKGGKIAGNIRKHKLKTDIVFKTKDSLEKTKFFKMLRESGKVTTWNDNYDWTGKKHSEETKKKMSESSKGMGEGSTNSQYGTCWVTNEKESKKINKGGNIPIGWRLGRKIK